MIANENCPDFVEDKFFVVLPNPSQLIDMRIFEQTWLLESEDGKDRGYQSRSIKDCEAINAKTAKQRVGQAKPLELKPGKYVFRVTNRNVPYELGFWLCGASVAGRVTLPSVSGGGLMPGKTQDYAIELKPGEYVYSCPLNTTPDYKLVVR